MYGYLRDDTRDHVCTQGVITYIAHAHDSSRLDLIRMGGFTYVRMTVLIAGRTILARARAIVSKHILHYVHNCVNVLTGMEGQKAEC